MASWRVRRGGEFCNPEVPRGGTRRHTVDELVGRFTTRLSRLFIHAAGLIFGDRNTGDAVEFGGESTSIRGFTSGKPSSQYWFG